MPPESGDDYGGAGLQGKKLEIGQGVEDLQPAGVQSEIGDAFSGARVRGKYDGKILADLKQGLENALQNRGVVDIGRTMQGDQRIALGLRMTKAVVALALGGGQELHQGIDHHVADAENLFGGDTLVPKIRVRVLGRRKQQVGELIGQQPVDFLRHGAVEGAQSGFDVADAHSKLGRNQSGGNG